MIILEKSMNVECYFYPERYYDVQHLPDKISGKVIYDKTGEYNPESWLKNIIIERKHILYLGIDNRNYRCNLLSESHS